jgi:hypothetical protein
LDGRSAEGKEFRVLLASASAARRLDEVGYLLGALGAVVIFIGIASNVVSQRRSYEGVSRGGHRRERLVLLAGSFLIGLAFLVLLAGTRVK